MRQKKRQHYKGIWVSLNGVRTKIDGNGLDWTTHSSGTVACVQSAKLPDGTFLITSNVKGSGYFQVSKDELQAFIGGMAQFGITAGATQQI